MAISQTELRTLEKLSSYRGAGERCRAISEYVLKHKTELRGASHEMQVALLSGIADSYSKNPRSSLEGKVVEATTLLYDLLSPVTNAQSEIARLKANPQTVSAIQDHFDKVMDRLTVDNAPRQLNAFLASVSKALHISKVPKLFIADIGHQDDHGHDHDHSHPKLITKGLYFLNSHKIEINKDFFFDESGKFKKHLVSDIQNTIIHELTHAYNNKVIVGRANVVPLFEHYTRRGNRQDIQLSNNQLIRQALAAAGKLPYDAGKRYNYYRKNVDEMRAFQLGDKWDEIVKESRSKIDQERRHAAIESQKRYLANPLPSSNPLSGTLIPQDFQTRIENIKLTSQRLLDLAATAEYALNYGAAGQANSLGIDYYWQKSLSQVMEKWTGGDNADMANFRNALIQAGKDYANNPNGEVRQNTLLKIEALLINNSHVADEIMKHSPTLAALDEVRTAERMVSGFYQYLNMAANPEKVKDDEKQDFADAAFNIQSLHLITSYQNAHKAALSTPGSNEALARKAGMEAVRQTIRKLDYSSGVTEAVFESYSANKVNLARNATPEERHKVWHGARMAGLEKADSYYRHQAETSLRLPAIHVKPAIHDPNVRTVALYQGAPDKSTVKMNARSIVQHLNDPPHFGAGREASTSPAFTPAVANRLEETAEQKPVARINHSFSMSL